MVPAVRPRRSRPFRSPDEWCYSECDLFSDRTPRRAGPRADAARGIEGVADQRGDRHLHRYGFGPDDPLHRRGDQPLPRCRDVIEPTAGKRQVAAPGKDRERWRFPGSRPAPSFPPAYGRRNRPRAAASYARRPPSSAPRVRRRAPQCGQPCPEPLRPRQRRDQRQAQTELHAARRNRADPPRRSASAARRRRSPRRAAPPSMKYTSTTERSGSPRACRKRSDNRTWRRYRS